MSASPGLLVMILAFALACSGPQSTQSAVPPTGIPTRQARVPTLDPTRSLPSKVEDVPVPVEAVVMPSPNEGDQVGYTVPGAVYQDLVGWYDVMLPAGNSFDKWSWCERVQIPHGDSRIYFSESAGRTLTVSVADGSPPSIRVVRQIASACPD